MVDKQIDKLIALLCTCTYGITNVVPPARAVTMAEVLSLHVKGSHGRWMEHCLMILHIPQTNFNSSKQVLVKFSTFCEANGTYIYILHQILLVIYSSAPGKIVIDQAEKKIRNCLFIMCNYNINGWWSIVTSGKMQEIPNSTR